MSYDELRLRLQLIAEEEVGARHRQEVANEDAVAAKMARTVSGSR